MTAVSNVYLPPWRSHRQPGRLEYYTHGMGARDTRRADLFSNRSLAILAGILWVAVVILAVAYLSGAGALSSVTVKNTRSVAVPT